MAACSVYGPSGRPCEPSSVSARANAAKPAMNEQLIPARTILRQQQHRLARRADARPRPRRLQLHQRHQPVRFRFVGHEPGQDAAEAQRVLAQVGAHPFVAARRRVAFVEDQVDDLEHRRQPRRQLGAARHLERHARLGQRALGAHDALRDGRLGHEEAARDLVGRQAAEQPQRQRHARLRRQHRMTRDQAPAAADRRRHLRRAPSRDRASPAASSSRLRSRLVVLALEHLPAAQLVDGAVLRRRHQPRARVVGDARLRPTLERRDERLLRQILGHADVANHAHEPADQPRGLDAPDRFDGLARGRLLVAIGRVLRLLQPRRFRAQLLFARAQLGRQPLRRSPRGRRSAAIVTSTPPSNGARLSHSTASSIDLTCQIQ